MWLLFVVIIIGTSADPVARRPAHGAVLAGVRRPASSIGCRALDEGGELELAHLFAGFRERTRHAGRRRRDLASGQSWSSAGRRPRAGRRHVHHDGQADPQAMAAIAGTTMVLAHAHHHGAAAAGDDGGLVRAPLVVFQRQGVIEAMKTSFSGCLKNILPFLVYGVVMTACSRCSPRCRSAWAGWSSGRCSRRRSTPRTATFTLKPR